MKSETDFTFLHQKKMKIVSAQISDIVVIQQLARKSWEKAYSEILTHEQIEYMLGTMYSETEIASQMQNPDYYYFLILDEENPAGFIGFQHHYEKSTTKLHRLYLLEESKGKGFGKAGIDFLKLQTQKSGDRRIILNVNKNNIAKTIYEKLGFSVYGEGVFDIGNGFVMDDYLMEIFV